eukprot:scaffold8463_cov56-Phaeocystis_antarctica.AAC.1
MLLILLAGVAGAHETAAGKKEAPAAIGPLVALLPSSNYFQFSSDCTNSWPTKAAKLLGLFPVSEDLFTKRFRSGLRGRTKVAKVGAGPSPGTSGVKSAKVPPTPYVYKGPPGEG